MNYLAHLKVLQKRERTDFTQFMQVPPGEFSDQSAKVATDLGKSSKATETKHLISANRAELAETSTSKNLANTYETEVLSSKRRKEEFMPLFQDQPSVCDAERAATRPPVVVSQGDGSQYIFLITKELALGVDEPIQRAQEEKLEKNASYDSCKNCVKSDITCSQCNHRSVFGNCTVPMRAGLSPTFKLISHPQSGRGCVAFSKRLNFFTEEALELTEAALAAGAIDADDAAIAQSAIKAADGHNPLIAEWRSLLNACALGVAQKIKP